MSDTASDSARVHLRWAMTEGIGPIVFGRLLMHFGTAEKALGVSASQLEDVKGIGRKTADAVARARDAADVDDEIAIAAEHGVRIICREDAGFPEALKRIPDTPIVLYVKGELRDTDAVALAVVGTRKCTIYGSEQARRFGELLAGAGFTVVSGLARGIDAFAQHGAVDAGGRSIAVLGNGLSEIYPPENRALADKLVESGALVSELPMRTTVRATNFDPRNRIIAGLSLGTLVVEAPRRSGAMITARYASDYNREVFAVPGRVQDPASFGTNALIRDGAAKLVMTLEDILEELGEVGEAMLPKAKAAADQDGRGDAQREPGDPPFHEPSRDRQAAEAAGAPLLPGVGDGQSAEDGPDARDRPRRHPLHLPTIEQRVYDLIGYDPILQDAVLSASSFPPGEVLAAFTALELKGLIKRLPGQLVVRGGKA